MKVTTVSEMRAMDRRAVEQYGIPELMLMENAGIAAFSVLNDHMDVKGKRILVFCGSGNNGGDGFVVARQIHARGGSVRVFLLGKREKVAGISKINLDILDHLPIEISEIGSAADIRIDIAHCDAMVDAILGTGLSSDVRGHYKEVMHAMNAANKPILSLDIPSGVSGDTGQVMGTAVNADWTVTFGLPKIGNLLYPGVENGGMLYATFISFPQAITADENLQIALNTPVPLPPRNPEGHKGDFGDALFIAGSAHYFGAPYFAGMAFLKAGGGYCRLAAPRSMVPYLANKGSEIVYLPQNENDSGSLSLANADSLADWAEKTDLTIIGPGLSLDSETRQLVIQLVRRIRKPLIIDGDGITAVCEDLDAIRSRSAETVLTPHMGEMSRITGQSIGDINHAEVPILQKTAADLNAYLVLKGAHSLIGYPDQRVYINTSGNSGMATAGTGDVLVGTIAAMFGLGLAFGEAVRKGVFIHGFAGDLAADHSGKDGITAQDILDQLPKAVQLDRDGIPEPFASRYLRPKVIG